MHNHIDLDDFLVAFARLGRGHQFSSGALSALFAYFEQIEVSEDILIELDPIAICGDWVEVASARDALASYGMAVADEREEDALHRLRDATEAIAFGDGTRLVLRAF